MFRFNVRESYCEQKDCFFFFRSVVLPTRGKFCDSGLTPLCFFHTINPNCIERSWNQAVHLEFYYVPGNMLHNWGHWDKIQTIESNWRDQTDQPIKTVFSWLSVKSTCISTVGDDVAINSGYRWLPQQQSWRVCDINCSQTPGTVQS